MRVTTPLPLLDVTNLRSGATATLALSGGTPGALALFALSLGGAGPVPTPFGSILLTPPIAVLPLQSVGGSGSASFNLSIPLGAMGAAVFLHAGELLPAGMVRLGNARALVVQ